MLEDSQSGSVRSNSQTFPPSELGSTSNTIASLYYDNKRLGCALFARNSHVIRISQVHRELDIAGVVAGYVRKNDVNVLLINERLRQEVDDENLDVIVVASKDYQSEGIESSLLLFDSSHPEVNRKDILRAILDPRDAEVEKAVGALTYHLLHAKLIDRRFKLESIQWAGFGDIVLVSPSTYDYLDLEREQMHPCKGVQGRGKEGFTIFNIYLTFSLTDLGKRMLSDLFMNPTYNRTVLEERYDTVEFLHRRLFEHEKLLNKYLRRIYNVTVLLNEFELIKNKPDDWRKFRNSLDNMVLLQRVVVAACHQQNQTRPPPKVLAEIEALDMGPIISLLELLDRCLEFSPLRVKQGVDRHLDKLRNTYEEMERLLTLYAAQQEWSFDFSLQFQLQLGYVVVVPCSVDSSLLSAWQLQYRTESYNIYTNDFTRILDERFGDICTEIIDIEDELIIDLQSHVRTLSEDVRNVYRLLCQFDCWLAVAKVSRSLVRPQLSNNKLILMNGWHMLLGQKSVNNHAFSLPYESEAETSSKVLVKLVFNSEQNMVNSNYTNRCCILSGPNGAGKTVYVKQTSIIVFLAHIGSFVPAELACVPLVDQIVCSSSARSLYMDHYGLDQQLFGLGRCLGQLTNRSLVVLDEVGHSTSQANAQTMLYGAVKFLTERQLPDHPGFQYEQLRRRQNNLTVRTPLSFIVTHTYSLFNREQLQQSHNIRFFNAMIFQEEDRGITYLYRIRPGRYNESVAIETCRKLQISNKLIEFAEHYHQLIRLDKPLVRQHTIKQRCFALLQGLSRSTART